MTKLSPGFPAIIQRASACGGIIATPITRRNHHAVGLGVMSGQSTGFPEANIGELL